MLLSSVLLTIPLLGYYYARETQTFLLQGQEHAHALTARAVATVLHDRADLFHPKYGLPLPLDEAHQVVAHMLPQPVRLDGRSDDWGPVANAAQVFGAEHVLQTAVPFRPDSLGLRLALGVRGRFIFALITVKDDRVLFRHPLYSRLDNSDHVRLLAQDVDGRLVRFLLTAEGPGTGSTYVMHEDWIRPMRGTPDNRIRSEWRRTDTGYQVEVRLPEALLGRDARLAFVIADVDDAARRSVATLLGTVPTPRVDALNRLLVHSPEIDRILTGLDRPGARIWVVDMQQRVRAVRGSLDDPRARRPTAGSGLRRALLEPVFDAAYSMSASLESAASPATLRDRLVAKALAGRPGVGRTSATNGQGVLIATHPIWSEQDLIGAVVVEQSESQVLAVERRTMENLIGATIVVFAVVGLVLLGFATRLTLRIRRLRNAADAAIGPHGRIRTDHLDAGTAAGDEIGDLARSMSDMLQRLAQYTRYLELMPRTLKHEMQNPLNTVSTSLQNLAEGVPAARGTTYMVAAERGVRRLGAILDSLTEAANLEEALQREVCTDLDLHALVARYVENVATGHPEHRFAYDGTGPGAHIRASDDLIEQMLDKLIDNAMDFSPADSTIAVRLARTNGEVHLSVRNEGPPLPAELRGQLFESMVSGRGPGEDDRPHLGMGLYVVRVIAEHHGGGVEAADAPGGTGTVFTVHLPLAGGNAAPPTRPRA